MLFFRNNADDFVYRPIESILLSSQSSDLIFICIDTELLFPLMSNFLLILIDLLHFFSELSYYYKWYG